MPVALVTGASSGIGCATALLLKEKGYTVYALSRSGKAEEGLIPLSCDVTDEAALTAALSRIKAEQGRLDALISNAGFGISGAVETTKVEDAQRLFDVNVFGGLRCVKAALPLLRQSQGHIVFTSSVAAKIGIPFQAFYSASKAALNLMALALANEVRPFHIKVTCVMPGDVKTAFTDSREKSAAGEALYGARMQKAVQSMEKDERGGLPPAFIARSIYRQLIRRNPPPLVTPGFSYKLVMLLDRLLPTRTVNWIVGLLYGG